ncbi:sigma-70 family RNA polymerase sigma factor [Pectobacterium versatile]
MTTVAHGLVVNHWRRKDIENAYLQVLAEQEFTFAPSLEQQVMVVDALMAIDQMLATLPGKVRQAFLLVHLDCLTYRQVAEQLAVSERMVKKYMAQAMLNCLLCQDL